MPDERRVSRQEPITVTTDGGRFEAHPLPWRKRIDVGNQIVADYHSALTQSIDSIKAGKQTLPETYIDYTAEFQLLYPGVDHKEFDQLSFEEMIEVLVAALDVNKLSDLRYMIDPNLDAPSLPVMEKRGANEDGQKTTSQPDSSSPESLLPPLTD